ncbi:MAG: hypothetical protein LBD13_00550 [Spirochaetaceae bacterium]|jgi:hypothetical protein|nr:hypothetical protein [Spirochaetaceae bacterium]
MAKQTYIGMAFAALLWGTGSAAADAQAAFTIRFYDKQVYYVSEAPIYVQVTITNNTAAPFRFKLADDRAFSLDFNVRTMTNRSIEPARILIRKRTQYQHVYFREITVESGEAFSFVEDLRNYADLSQSGTFMVQGTMYPELYRETGSGDIRPLESNRLPLSIRPPSLQGPDGIPLEMDAETNAVLAREKLPPDEVVRYLLSARQKSQWEKFFLYLDVEAMLARDPVRQRQWLSESEEGRRRMVARYREDVRNATADSDIANLPIAFQIERTTYNEMEGTVTVQERFRIGTVTERKRYVYYLYRKDDIWSIVDYSVNNLGTE